MATCQTAAAALLTLANMAESAPKRAKTSEVGAPPAGAVPVPSSLGNAKRMAGKVIVVTGGTQGSVVCLRLLFVLLVRACLWFEDGR